jgi:hypothetical protein
MKIRKNTKWDIPFYTKIQQRNAARRPNQMKLTGKRLYRITEHIVPEPRLVHQKTMNSITGYGRSVYGQFGYEQVIMAEVKWLKPKQATLLILQGRSVQEIKTLDSEHKPVYNRYISLY